MKKVWYDEACDIYILWYIIKWQGKLWNIDY